MSTQFHDDIINLITISVCGIILIITFISVLIAV